jgi:hypothetical protein
MTTAPETLTAPAEVLAAARAQRAAADAAEAQVLLAACTWADLHPPETLADAAWADDHCDGEVLLAGEGAPAVAAYAVAEFAAALGMSTGAGYALVGEGLEMRHRLPRVWKRVMEGGLAPWRGRRIARATLALSSEAADYVDRQVAGFAHRIGPVQTDRLVETAMVRFQPELAAQRRRAAADGRHFDIDHGQVSYNGTSFVNGELDLADAQDLDAAIADMAGHLAHLGCEESLDVRRSLAAGELARRQLAFHLSDSAAPTTRRRTARKVVINVHMSVAAVNGAAGATARVESLGGLQLVTVDQVRDWCQSSHTRVTVQPVIDLADRVSVDAYEVPPDLKERVVLAHPTCVFPWCTRQSRRTDADHVIPYPQGPTATDNLAPLCRHHHQHKTRARWRYRRLGPTTYLWTSPHRLMFLRDHTGTTALDDT